MNAENPSCRQAGAESAMNLCLRWIDTCVFLVENPKDESNFPGSTLKMYDLWQRDKISDVKL